MVGIPPAMAAFRKPGSLKWWEEPGVEPSRWMVLAAASSVRGQRDGLAGI
jgi:hypothetical protein